MQFLPTHKIIKKTKRYMLLLEVLIAMALVALCVLPIIAPQIAILKEQKAFVHQMKLDHTMHLGYVYALEQLYKKEIPWNAIESKTPFPLPADILPPGINGTYFFKIVKEKNDGSQSANIPKEWAVYRLELTFAFSQQNSKIKEKNPKQLTSFPYEITIVRRVKEA